MFRDDAMANFERWLHTQQQRGDGQLLWPKVELRRPVDDESMGYGLFAREDIRLNEIAIKVPERTMLTAGMVADIPEYAYIMERVQLDPAEVLALFFCFERVHFDCFCEQSADGVPFLVQWEMDIPPGFARFIQMRKSRRPHQKSADDDDEFWWRPYLGILPLRFGTPLFRHFLRGDDFCRLRRVADKLPQEAKSKLLGQLAELRVLEKKLFNLLYPFSNCVQKANGRRSLEGETFDASNFDKLPRESIEFWREMCCWAWHVVNTRCIFLTTAIPRGTMPAAAADSNGGRVGGCDGRWTAGGQKIFQRVHIQLPITVTTTDRGEEEEDYGGSLAIVPLVDMLNHSTDAQCVAMFDHKHSRHYLIRADQHFVPAGNQLFVCYGAHDNARLWVEYGFRMNAWNPFNRVAMPQDLFIALAERCGVRVSDRRREVLGKANLCCTIYATDDEPSFALRKSCTILLLEREKLQNWSQHIFGDYFGEGQPPPPPSPRGEMKLLGSILGLLQKALEGRKANCCVAGGDEDDDGEEEEETALLCSLWDDQIDIVRRMAAHLAEEDKKTIDQNAEMDEDTGGRLLI
uniref:SET domain-containing protein n=1 Tax=Globodera rostochiensis TaxID=31243 RepID=A0A914IA68_GLORO